jgi:hypothetical protein
MSGTEAFHLASPTEEDLAVAEATWVSGEARYAMRTDAPWWRVLRARSLSEAGEFASTWYPSPTRARFTPLQRGGTIVPAAYAGSTREISIWEVILRNIRHEGIRRIPEHETRDRYLVKALLYRPLHLFDIRRPRDVNLTAAGKRAPDLTAAWPQAYDVTRLWAQALYDRLPDLDGIIYESHQVSGQCVVLYHSHRSIAPLFTVQSEPESVREGNVRKLLLKEAQKAGVSVDFGEEEDEEEDSTW